MMKWIVKILGLGDLLFTPGVERLSLGRLGQLVGLVALTWGFVHVTKAHGFVEGMWWAYGAATGVVFLFNKGLTYAKDVASQFAGKKKDGEE